MANDTYSADSGQGIYAGRFSNTPLSDFIAAMPSNSWAEYTGTNINEMTPRDFDGALMGVLESSGNYTITNWANKFAWNPARKIISGVGTSQGFTIPEGYNYTKQVNFDLTSNAFTVRWNPTGQVQGHIYDHNCGNFVNDKTWRKPSTSGRLGMYDAATDTWSLSYDLTGLPNLGSFWGIECSAGHNALYCIESTSGRLVKFDLTTGIRTVIGSYSGIGTYPVIVETGEFIVFGGGSGGGSFYKIDVFGTVSLITNSLSTQYSANGNYRFLAHPSITNAVIMFGSDGVEILDVLTGVASRVGDYPTEPSLAASVSASLVGLGAIATWRGRGRSNNATQSQFYIYKV